MRTWDQKNWGADLKIKKVKISEFFFLAMEGTRNFTRIIQVYNQYKIGERFKPINKQTNKQTNKQKILPNRHTNKRMDIGHTLASFNLILKNDKRIFYNRMNLLLQKYIWHKEN